jgi:hypothetical protein
MKTSLLGSVLLGTFVVAIPALANVDDCYTAPGNVVVNCGFENGTYTNEMGGYSNPFVPVGWTPNVGFDYMPGYNQVRTGPVYQGTYALSIGNTDAEPVPSLSQTFHDISGATYTGSLFIDYGGAGDGDSGAFFQTLIDSTAVVSLDDTAPGPYTEYTFSFVGTGSDTLTLQGNTNPSEWFVDDITISTTATTPEPALYLPLVIMLGALWWRTRRRAAIAHKA